jgi:hypothetical protein
VLQSSVGRARHGTQYQWEQCRSDITRAKMDSKQQQVGAHVFTAYSMGPSGSAKSGALANVLGVLAHAPQRRGPASQS